MAADRPQLSVLKTGELTKKEQKLLTLFIGILLTDRNFILTLKGNKDRRNYDERYTKRPGIDEAFKYA
jgi:hypothetical protein